MEFLLVNAKSRGRTCLAELSPLSELFLSRPISVKLDRLIADTSSCVTA